MIWVVLFWCDAAGFLKITLIRSFKKEVFPGRVEWGGTEGEIVVAHGRLPSPAPQILPFYDLILQQKLKLLIHLIDKSYCLVKFFGKILCMTENLYNLKGATGYVR